MIRRRAMVLGRAVHVAAVVAAVCGGVSIATRARAEIADRIVATIDGEPITAHEMRRWAKEHDARDAPDGQVLDALITEKLLEKEIAAQGIAAKDDEIDRYIAAIRERNGMEPDRFAKALEAQGLTTESYRTRVKAEIEKAQLVNREIRQHVNVSPEEVRRYYDAHKDDYATAERVKVRDILFVVDGDADAAEEAHVRAKAEEVRELAAKGRDFGALARQFSEGAGADKGGELGTFSRGDMESALDDVVFKLKPGQVSDVVRARGGFHVLRVDDRIDGGHKPLEEVSDDIRESLYNDALEARFQQWMSKDLRERHHVEVFN